MDTLNTQETVWKEEHPTVTHSTSTQGNMSSSTSQFNAAARADSREPSPGNPEIPTSNKSPSTRRRGAGFCYRCHDGSRHSLSRCLRCLFRS
jgi:hypothetical protein